MEILTLLLGLALILGGANFLTDGAAALAQRLRIPEFIVGLTVVAIGTSTPELTVSLLSALAGQCDMAIGNVVGSNLFNTLVILGLCAVIRPVVLSRENIRRDIPLGLGAALLLALLAADHTLGLGAADRLSRGDGIAMLLLYAALLGYTIRTTPRPAQPVAASARPMRPWLMAAMIVGGLAALVWGGELFLGSATSIARRAGIDEATIAITLLAGGTSLPELAASVVSLIKGKAELALGNVIGSNVANILLILGLSATITPLPMGGITLVDLGMTVLSALLLFLAAFTFRRRELDRWEGVIFLALYGTYLWQLLDR